MTSLSLFTLEKEMATHSSILAWRIPGTGEPGRLPSVGLHTVGHDRSDLAAAVEHKNSGKQDWHSLLYIIDFGFFKKKY